MVGDDSIGRSLVLVYRRKVDATKFIKNVLTIRENFERRPLHLSWKLIKHLLSML